MNLQEIKQTCQNIASTKIFYDFEGEYPAPTPCSIEIAESLAFYFYENGLWVSDISSDVMGGMGVYVSESENNTDIIFWIPIGNEIKNIDQIDQIRFLATDWNSRETIVLKTKEEVVKFFNEK